MPETQQLTTLSDLIVAYLEQLGVEYVFGIPGGHIAPLYEALHRSKKRGGPRAITNCHETGAAFMAAGYALETGKLGVCLTTAGPGATNIITGVAEAYAAHAPLLVISGQTGLPTFGRGALQECSPHQGSFPDIIDTISMLEHCTCYNTLITHPSQVQGKLAAALISAHQSLKGPAHIGIPADILRAPHTEAPIYPNLPSLLDKAASASFADMAAVQDLAKIIKEVLEQDRKVAFFIGYECDGAIDDIMSFAELIHAPVVSSLRGKSRVNPYHPLFKGVFGMAGHTTAREALADESVGLILAVGTTLGQLGTAGWNPILMNEKLVHIHHSNTYFLRSPMARLHVCGSADIIFKALSNTLAETLDQSTRAQLAAKTSALAYELCQQHAVQKLPPPHIELIDPDAYFSEATPIKPQRLMHELMCQFPPETLYLLDNGTSLDWIAHYFFLANFKNLRLITTGPCSMGWAPGSAIGTAMGSRGTPVVCVVGDASYLMYGHEIIVAIEEQLPVIFIILNDSSLGAIKHRNDQVGTINLEFPVTPTDFALMAKSVGAVGYTLRKPDDFAQLDYVAMCQRAGPTVLDVRIDAQEVPPIAH